MLNGHRDRLVSSMRMLLAYSPYGRKSCPKECVRLRGVGSSQDARKLRQANDEEHARPALDRPTVIDRCAGISQYLSGFQPGQCTYAATRFQQYPVPIRLLPLFDTFTS
jgi:hypothetical protein